MRVGYNILSKLQACTQEVAATHIYAVTAMMNMYAKCGCIAEARRMFDGLRSPNIVAWNTIILGYAENGEADIALDLFCSMKQICDPNTVTYLCALKACTSLALCGKKRDGLERGRSIHLEMHSNVDLHVYNTLIDMYSKCGSMVDARIVFDRIVNADVVSWSALVLGYAVNRNGAIALEMLWRMQQHGIACNSATYVAALKACSSLAVNGEQGVALERGKQIHRQVGCRADGYVQNVLIDMYSKCGCMSKARDVFENSLSPDVVSWTALISGYAENGNEMVALDLFYKMKKTGRCVANAVTYIAVIKACANLASKGDEKSKIYVLKRGRELHAEAASYFCSLHIQNTLIDMYAKCGSMREAQKTFDTVQSPDVVSWNTLIMGYAGNGGGQVALDLFSRMSVAPDPVSYIAAIKACTSLAVQDEDRRAYALQRGREIHAEIGLHSNQNVKSALIDMYSICGSMEEAHKIFSSIPFPDVVSWNALILGYAENGEGKQALDLFNRMKATPDSVTYIAVLKACSTIGELSLGRKVHNDVVSFTPHLVTCLVDFYAKCGSIEEACEVFELHWRERELSTWNAQLSGYARLGDSVVVLNLFEALGNAGFHPNEITFVCLLVCCSHAGLVEKARECFESMPLRYGVSHDKRHYTCMVDVLGRSNRLEEAAELIRAMPYEPNAATWTTLLAACRKWKNEEIGRWAFQSLVSLDKRNGPAYVLMGDLWRCDEKAYKLEQAKQQRDGDHLLHDLRTC